MFTFTLPYAAVQKLAASRDAAGCSDIDVSALQARFDDMKQQFV
jgi:hypothetical protein